MVQCEGWWQQRGLGRQYMTELEINIQDRQVFGTGVDCVAPFEIAGTIREDGVVELRKNYEFLHSVIYAGRYDGEGTFWGTWAIGNDRGDWTIRISRDQPAADSAAMEIGPDAPFLF